jgi:glycosyltransferase involved in cell wall biosynthesis
MRRKRYAVVDVNTLPDFLIFAGIFARFMGAKLLLDMHEITPEFYMSKYGIEQNSLPIRVLTHLEKISFDFADHVLTINEPIQDLLAKRGLRYEKCTIVMNSADEANFAVPKNVSVPSADFVMMYHGTLTKLYGLDIAIEAFATVKDQMPGAEFWILGGGTEAPALKKLVQDRGLESRVKLMGSVRPSEIPAWLNKCDLGILPLRRDVFLDFASPNKLAEFIIMGKPVIISRLKAVQRYFSDDALAFCEPNDTASLAREMSNVYKDSARRARMVANARSEYMPIRWDVMKERYLAIVDHLADAVPEVEQSRSGRAII